MPEKKTRRFFLSFMGTPEEQGAIVIEREEHPQIVVYAIPEGPEGEEDSKLELNRFYSHQELIELGYVSTDGTNDNEAKKGK